MKQKTSTVPEDFIVALVIGATIVLLLAVVENQRIAPDLARTLLSPGHRLAYTYGHGARDIGVVLAAMVDTVVYGFPSFLVLRVLRTMLNK